MTDAEALKREAAARAVQRVESGMKLGLGTGTTVAHFLDLLGERIATGELTGVRGVPTSVWTAERCKELGIALGELEDLAPLDLAVDGADEVAPDLSLIKGLGGALLREKIVAAEASRFIVIADERKVVRRLGERAPLPVEVVPFAWRVHLAAFREVGSEPTLRRGGDSQPVVTDNGNYIVDLAFGDGISDPPALARTLSERPGVVETGLFIGMATEAFIATAEGVRTLGPVEVA